MKAHFNVHSTIGSHHIKVKSTSFYCNTLPELFKMKFTFIR